MLRFAQRLSDGLIHDAFTQFPTRGDLEMLRERCANDNHGRAVVRIRFCPNCGVVLNDKILATKCREENHASARRHRNTFCVDCGEQLLAGGSGR